MGASSGQNGFSCVDAHRVGVNRLQTGNHNFWGGNL